MIEYTRVSIEPTLDSMYNIRLEIRVDGKQYTDVGMYQEDILKSNFDRLFDCAKERLKDLILRERNERK